MLIYGPGLSLYSGSSVPVLRLQTESIWHKNCKTRSINCPNKLTRRSNITCKSQSEIIKFKSFSLGSSTLALASFLTAAVVIASVATADTNNFESETLSNIPQTLSGEDCKKAKIQKPKSRKAESCTIKCVTTCIRGGDGSPGEGPLNVRRPLVVFKQGFRTRQYCLVECSDICNLISDAEDGP